MIRALGGVILVGVALAGAASAALAQQSTSTTSKQTKAFEVIAVNGNDLIVKLPEGTREMKVPDDFRFNVDGRDLSVHDLKPGMKGTAMVTTKTTVTPVSVTEVKNGTVMQASGSSIVVRTADGIKMFTEGDIAKRGVQIVRNGEPASLSDFHSGDTLTATIVTTKPPKILTEKQVQATLARTGAPTAASSATPAGEAPGAARATAAGGTGSTTRRKLPKTAGPLPLVGFAGAVSLSLAAALAVRRRRFSR
ncbi:MAG TPA: hypothetical protein VGI12_07795 [Vicinamibacterales bacterium]|jgi:hypothetical protein